MIGKPAEARRVERMISDLLNSDAQNPAAIPYAQRPDAF